MSFYDDASLIMYPSGYKADKIYSLKPTDGSGDFDFARASSATRVNADGLIESVATGVPRIDYTGGGCGKLLLEGQRTNLITYSNDFSNASWTKSNNGTGVLPIINTNQAISPDGTQNADELIFNAGGGTTTSDLSQLQISFTVTSGSTYTGSIWLKGENNGEQILLGQLSGSLVLITLTTEWVRYDFTQVSASSPRPFNIGIRQGIFGTINNNITVYAYGAQLEAGSYPTSYIPTAGSQVTRVVDACSQTPPSGIIGQTEGTLFVDVDFIDIGGVQVLLSVHDGASNKRLEIWANGSAVNGFIGGSVNIAIGNTTISEGRHKLALAYNQSGDQAFYVDGVQIGTSSTAYTIAALTQLSYSAFNGSLAANGSINNTIIFPTRLSNAELQALTTI